MHTNELYITKQDHDRLREYLDGAAPSVNADAEELRKFAAELDGRRVVDGREIAPAVVTMHSRVRLMDINTMESLVVTLVYPEEADLDLGKLSVLSTAGSTLLGRSVGDVFEWRSPVRLRRLLVKELFYQPEAAGNYEQ